MNDLDAIESYWQAFLSSGKANAGAASAGYEAWAFGHDPQDADSLGGLVLQRLKTATASLVWFFEAGTEAFPQVGGYSVILDGRGQPMAILQTTQVDVVPFAAVDAGHAYLEGEGDRSLQYWRDVHWRYFGVECRQLGREPDAQMPVVCERFRLVYP